MIEHNNVTPQTLNEKKQNHNNEYGGWDTSDNASIDTTPSPTKQHRQDNSASNKLEARKLNLDDIEEEKENLYEINSNEGSLKNAISQP